MALDKLWCWISRKNRPIPIPSNQVTMCHFMVYTFHDELYNIKICYSMLTLHFPGSRKMSRWSAIKMVFRTCTRNWTHAWCWLHYNIDILLPKINWKYAAGRGLSQWKMELTNKSQDFIITCWMYIIIEDIMSEYFKGIYSKDNNLRVHLGNINVCRLLINAKYPKFIIVFIFHGEIYLHKCVLRNTDIFI